MRQNVNIIMDFLALKKFLYFVVISMIGLHGTSADYVIPPDGQQHKTKECPSGWTSLHRGCYKFFGKYRQERRAWNDANTACQDLNGELNILQSKSEKLDIERYLGTHFNNKRLWINLEKEDSIWRWGDESDVDETMIPWASPKLRDRPRTPCGALAVSKARGLSLTNDRCTSKKGYICEYHDISPRASTLSVLEEQTTGNSVQDHTVEQPSSHKTTTQAKLKPTIATTPVSTTAVKATATSTQITEDEKSSIAATLVTHPEKTRREGVFARSTVGSPSTKKGPTTPRKGSRSTRVLRSTTGTETFVTSSTTTSDDLEPEHETETDTDVVTEQSHKTTTYLSTISKLFPSGLSKGPGKHLSSPIFVPTIVTTTEAPDDDDGDDGEDDGIGIEEIIHGTSRPRRPFNRKGGFRPTSPHPRRLWTPTPRVKILLDNSFSYWVEAMEDYEGCYIPGLRGAVRQMVMTARNMYKEGAEFCPQVTASLLTFPRTEAGETAVVKCRRGTGFATLHCGDDTVCWEDQPDLSGCASPKLKALLEKIKEEQIEKMVSPSPEKETAIVEKSVNMTSELVSMTEDDDISVEDILVTSEVLTAFSHSTEDREVKVRDRKVVKRIVGNVVKAGSNLLSKKKKKLWRKMERGDKIRSASSLMVAMETATLSMADNIEEPTVIKQVEENVEVEIQVVDVEKLEEEEEDEIVYDSQQSDNKFSIPVENLKKSTNDSRLDKIVFITHYSMAEFLDARDDDEDDDDVDVDETDVPDQVETIGKSSVENGQNASVPEDGTTRKEDGDVTRQEEEEEDEDVPPPQIASHILSATIGSGRGGHKIKLRKPVRFTMRHTMEVRKQDIRLCSFWDVSQGGSQGFWSQEGCEMKKSNSSHTTCECDHMTSFAILIDVHGLETPDVHQTVLRLITIIGCVISCLCLIVSWFTFQFCTALQGERNSIHKNLTACLFVSELLFVAGVTHTEPKITCSLVAVFLHFFFLCAFTWMFLEGLHIIFMLVQVFDASRSRLPYYYGTGYGLPLLVVVISCIVYFPGYGTDEFCWLTTDRHFIWAFAGPVAVILLVNAIFLTYAMTTVCRHSDYVFNAKDRSAGSPIRSWIQGALALEVLLGLTWTFGYFLLDANTLPLAYAFTILNSLQGMFIFIFHCLLNKKAQKEYSRILRVPLGGMSSMFASTHSTGGKRTNGSTKCQEMTHSSSNGRKTSLNYKPSIGSQHNNYFNDKYNNHKVNNQNGDVHTKNEDDDVKKVLYNNNGDPQTDPSKDSDGVGSFNGNDIITMDD